VSVAENLYEVNNSIRYAERQFQRKDSICLLAVSKAQTASTVRKLYHLGQKIFGESYLQESIEKQKSLKDCDIEWHFIGSVQSNKTRLIAEHFSWVHSVSRYKVAKRLSEQRPSEKPLLNVCIEVNIDCQTTKSGVNTDQLLTLALEISALKRLRLRGLMVIPKYYPDFAQQKAVFDRVTTLQYGLVSQGLQLDTLSMGMSHDFRAAIAAGSTIVRIGSAIFGKRPLC